MLYWTPVTRWALVGAHPGGRIGENPAGVPNNLMPYICQVAAGRLEALRIFSGDYATADGTGVRDYIQVMDLAEGHVAALDAMDGVPAGTVMTVNLGTGRSVSVLELVEMVGRREGDIAEYYADPGLAKKVLGWEATRGVEEMCRDARRWQRQNPDGYR